MTLGGIVAMLAGPARAQDVILPKIPANERQSQRNPASRAHGDSQNRGRMSADYLWGLTNGNRTFDQPVYSRVPQETSDSPLFLDGWTYPFPRDAAGRRVGQAAGFSIAEQLFPGQVIDDVPIPPPTPPTYTVGASWTGVNGPSSAFVGAGYHRANVIPRPNGAPDINPANPTKLIWYPGLPGAVGQFQRFAIRVHVPQPAPDGSNEDRISDARYVVYYQIPLGGGAFRHASKVCFLSQQSGGDKYLVGTDGVPAVFPFVSEATYASGGVYSDGAPFSSANFRARVELDPTSESSGANLFVVGDSIELVQRPVTVKTTPVVVPPHGGRRIDTTQVPTAANPYHQPAAGAGYDGTAFVNNPQDPLYNIDVTAVFDPAETTTLFFGPTSLADPRNGALQVAPFAATNHDPYASPYFSHMQVLLARTDVVADPENGVAADQKDGTLTNELGSVVALDWLTGVPIWRFPDRTYLPGGLRNPQIGTDALGQAVFQVPGIVSYDLNNDGIVQDEEIFFGPNGNNPSGGLSASVTLVPRMSVLGQVQVPVRDVNGVITGITPANRGRYARPDAAVPGGFSPVQMPLAFIAAKNGILYAIDPFGNNDSRYAPNVDTTILGTYATGSTNLLWTFSPTSAPRVLAGPNAESLELYNRRVKTEIPVPGPYVGSTPVVSWAKSEDDATLDRATEEPRLFIGNQNGVVYAMDPRAVAGVNIITNTLLPLPIRKGEQTYNVNHLAHSALTQTDPYRQNLKWWFETLGSINANPAVSSYAFPRAGAPVAASKGVYVTTGEGRVYCIDWDGPVTKADHNLNQVWDGTAGDSPTVGSAPILPPPTNSAAALNDSIRFRNDTPALPGARPDLTEGTIRPRWAFPNRYRDIDAANNRSDQPIDHSQVFASTPLAEPFTSSGPIYSAPVLMDFVYLDPDNAAQLSGIRRYVVVATNDFNADAPDSPKTGRLVLLDQEGERRDFLSNPVPSVASAKVVPPAAPTPAANAVIYGQPLDQFVSTLGAFGRATPAWSYRFVYDTYVAPGSTPDIVQRNRTAAAGVTREPARRPVPTVFVGGTGRVFAIDIDDQTGLFVRWRANLVDQRQSLRPGVTIPGNEAVADRLNPNDPNNPANYIFNTGNKDTLGLGFKRVLARTVPLLGDASTVDGDLVITGGPVQNRNSSTAKTAADALTAQGAGQTVGPDVSLTVPPLRPSVPPLPTDDPPSLKWVLLPIATGVYAPFGYDLTPAVFANIIFPIYDLTGRYVNQDSDDPLTTTLGTLPEGTVVPAPVDGPAGDNNAFQYPSLLISTSSGYLHELSTNIEGEDPSAAAAVFANEPTASLGWATTEDPERFNGLHVYQVVRRGPGGPNSGIVAVTPAYFPGRDVEFARYVGTNPKPGTDPSNYFRFYPPQEPGTSAAPLGGPDFGDNPRPHLKPRGIFAGVAPAAPDNHTGQTGLPLDLNGLFYDKQYATVAGNTPNEAGQIRLPGYSGKGALTAAGTAPFDPQRPDTDTERRALNAALPPGSLPVVGNNINPSGHNATWIFVGGEDGLLYAYTPVFSQRLGGLPSGFVGGDIVRRNDPGEGEIKVDIFDLADYNGLLASAQAGTPQRPSRDGLAGPQPNTANVLSRAAKHERNFFEWGEVVPIVVWDVTVRAPYDAATPPANIPPIPANFAVTLRITARGGQTITRTINLARDTNTNLVATYPYDPSYVTPPVNTPAGQAPAQLGIAFYQFRIDASSGLPVTPGVPIQVQVDSGVALRVLGSDARLGRQIVVQVQGGAFENQILGRRTPTFWTANPLAVQGFLAETRSTAAGTLPVSVPKNAGDPPANGIGPFRNAQTDKDRVPANGALIDPDRDLADYSQALANGNTINRFDPDPYLPGAPLQRNPNFMLPLKDSNGGNDREFYVPVAASAGYINHGRTGSTDLSAGQRNLRVANRSYLNQLTRVRSEVIDDLIWRWWPANVPNTDASSGNLRKTPAGMGYDGRINPLPWETPVTEAQPWKRRAQSAAGGTVLALGNISPDYPDISAASAALQGRQTVSIMVGGSDSVLGPVTLPGGASIDLAGNPNPAGLVNPLAGNTGPFGAEVKVRVPLYQPANLVAMHSLTSTYEAPSTEDGVQSLVGDGKVQLPRGINSRVLRGWNGSNFNGSPTITPFGYTARVRVYVDANGNGIWDNQNGEEPFRIVELWMGVPVDLGLRSTESPVDLGALPGGFGLQNGILGYGGTIDPAEQAGLAPPPLRQPFAPFFRPFTIQNTGNVNLWNLRASQRIENPGTNSPGTGNSFYLFGLRSTTVDPRFGILAFAADPNASLLLPNVMPQVVTSLDPVYDAAWDSWYQSNPDPVFRTMMDYVTDNGQTNYQRYYAPTAGRHTLHKARPGSPTAATLGFPDLPGAQSLVPYGYVAPEPAKPMIGVAIPHGTPAGIYQSRDSSVAGAPPMLAVFEDHDTDPANGYQGVPVMNAGGVILPAGPLYNGFNGVNAAGLVAFPGVNPIQPASGQGILRARNVLRDAANNIVGLDYLPHTNPAIDLKVTVSETPVTGQSPDLSQIDAIFTGLLPVADRFPLLTANGRPASAITPAAYRTPNGRLNLYYARNAFPGNPATILSGQPFRLFRSHLNWNANLGTFVAANFGSPISNPTANTGSWFTPPVEITAAAGGTDSNTSPFVLQVAPTSTSALLLWTNTRLTAGGEPVDAIQYTTLDANGQPGAVAPWYLNPDPTVHRFGPRAIYNPVTSTTVLFFYGGLPGKWNLYYSPRRSDASGVPNDAVANGAGRQQNEFPLQIPTALTSASEPTAYVRTMASVNNGNAVVVDVMYTGVLRADQNPDLFLTRFRMDGVGQAARLVPITLPLQQNEQLVQVGRELVWNARHIAWNRDLGNNPFLPIITIRHPNGTTVVTNQARWQYDNAAQVLYQAVASAGGVLYVYVDAAGGTVRFRGAGAPTVRDAVLATYQPQTLRLTTDGAADTAPITVFDNQVLAPGQGVHPGVIRRPSATPLPVGRQWILWQKGAQPNRPAGLYYTTRRVGVDLRSLGIPTAVRLQPDESIALSSPSGGTQTPAVISVNVTGVGLVPFEVDYVNGRIYVNSFYEGLNVAVRYTAARGSVTATRTAQSTLQFLEELGATDSSTIGLQVPMQRGVNEGQVYGFLDLFDAFPGLSRPNGPNAAADPTLVPGRMWMFWTSSRGRYGRVPQPDGSFITLPSGFDLLYQTLAPDFEVPSLPGR